MKDSFHLVIDELDRELDERLALARDARRGAPHDQPYEAEREHAQDGGGDEGVEMQRPERRIAKPQFAKLEVVTDIRSRGEFLRHPGFRYRCYRRSRTKKAMLKKITVRTNVPKKGAGASCL